MTPNISFRWLLPFDELGREKAAGELAACLAPSTHAEVDAMYVPPTGGIPVDALAKDAWARLEERGITSAISHRAPKDRERLPVERLTEPDAERYDGVIVSRQTPRDSGRLRRLGPRPRKSILDGRVPTCIVPSDFRRNQLSDGPVLLAVDPNGTPPHAARVAARIAMSCERPLEVLHVNVTGHPASAPDPATALDDWCRLRGLETDAVHVVDAMRGEAGAAIEHLGSMRGACMIVCGTRARPIWSRIAMPSRALGIAAYARRPVTVVPPPALNDAAAR